jgi:hypothetical protein
VNKLFALSVVLCALTLSASASDKAGSKEHFSPGEVRVSLSWDNVSAMESRLLRFGGAAGVHVLNGIEIGIEQQFIVPPATKYESRSWGYVRAVPFPSWVVSPFLSARAGYYILPEKNAVGLGAGIGAVTFLDDHFAFEVSLNSQKVVHEIAPASRQMDFDTRVIVFF